MKRLLPGVGLVLLLGVLAPSLASAKDCMGDCMTKCTDEVTTCSQKCPTPTKQDDSGRYAQCAKSCAERSAPCYQRCSSRCSGK